MAVLEMLLRKANWRARRCSSAKSRAFSTATDSWPPAICITSRSRCSNTYSRSVFIAGIARALRLHFAVHDLQFNPDLITFLKGDIKLAGIENLSEFLLNRPQDFILVEPGADCLTDLRQQLEFFCTPLGVMHHDVVFQREPNLQSEPD